MLVLGDGRLGLLCAQVLATTGAGVTLVGKHESKLALVADRADTMLVHDWQPARVGVVVEATGAASGFELAMQCVRPRGTLVLKSTIAGEHQVSLASLVIGEVTLVGSRCGPFRRALAALGAGEVSVDAMVSATYDLDDGVAALRRAAQPGVTKVLLRT